MANLRLEIHVPMLPPNANRRSLVAYQNRKVDRHFASVTYCMALSARNTWEIAHGKRWPVLEKATVTIQFVTARKGRLPDYSNLWETTKMAKDRLVQAALFRDDAPTCLTWAMPEAGAQVVRGNEDMTIITLEGSA